ncbi:MAG TPA: hypothetical protein VFT63_05645 [bacterium]|nr:hypothetical protein [bacterium]
MLIRFGAIGLILAMCAFAGSAGLPVILDRLGTPYPVRVYNTHALAAIVLEPDGRIIIHMPAFLMHYENADIISFLYLHEVGHARLGHLLPAGTRSAGVMSLDSQEDMRWALEFDADLWAAQQAMRAGYDPVAGLTRIFALWGTDGGTTHPRDAERIERVRQAATMVRH